MLAPRHPPRPFTTAEKPAIGVAVAHLCKSYGPLAVLKDHTFEVKPGEILVLMGPSGAGKSVLLRQIAGLERPTSGEVTVDGRDAFANETREQIRLALVFQEGALFNSMSVFDNLALYPREHRSADEAGIRKKVTHALQILSVEDTAEKFPSDLSGGMRKRVAIARALVMEPQLMLYDEPTSELDAVMAATISEIIATLARETKVTTLVVSHDRELAFGIAHRIGILMDGALVTVGTPAELQAPQNPRITEFLHPKIDLAKPRFKRLET